MPSAGGATFVFGLRAAGKLYEYVGNLPRQAWQELVRPAKHVAKTEPRQRPANVKQQAVETRDFKDIRLAREYVAEFRHRPLECEREYRVIVLWKDLEVHQGQKKLFADNRCFFFITYDFRKSADAVLKSPPEAEARLVRSPCTPDRTTSSREQHDAFDNTKLNTGPLRPRRETAAACAAGRRACADPRSWGRACRRG